MLSDKDYQVMKDNDGGEMYRTITKIMNSVAAVQNPIRASIESLFNLLFIRGDQYDSLAEYYQTFENRRMTAECLGTLFASDGLRDLVIAEYISKKQTTSEVYTRLRKWQVACADQPLSMTEAMWTKRTVAIADGQLCLHEKMSAVIFQKRSGSKYDPYRQELNNDYGKGLDSFGDTIQEQHSNMEFWKPVYVMKETKKGSNFVQEGKKERRKRQKKHLVHSIMPVMVSRSQVTILNAKDLAVCSTNAHKRSKKMVLP